VITKIDTKDEQNILIGMITNTNYLGQIIDILNYSLFKISFSRKIIKWCVDYYKKYNKAPGKDIQDIYEAEKRKADNETEYALVGDFLQKLSEKHDDNFNVDFNLDKAEKYFRRRKLEVLKEDITAALLSDEIEEAEKEISDYAIVQRQENSCFSALKDEKTIRRLFETEVDDEIFRFPGKLNDLIGPLCRGDLYAVIAPGKRGKTFWLIDIGIRATLQKLKVLFVSLEMNEKKSLFRIHQNITGLPKYKREIIVPFLDEDEVILYKKYDKEALDFAKLNQKRKSIIKLTGPGDIKLVCYPAYSANIKTIENNLDRLEKEEDFVPDMIIIDYADILAPEQKNEYRHQIDHTWKAGRALAQKRNCIVMTASHTNKATYSRDINQGDVSEDARKINHVAGMWALNQSAQEKDDQIMRVKLIASRHDSFSLTREVQVLQCLNIGKPILQSKWK